jgi:hypothetical protein
MTLSEFITQICLLVNRVDNDSKLACGNFVRFNYKKIYDSYPWRDSELVADPINIGPTITSPLAPSGIDFIPFPSGMERIVKIGLISTAGTDRVITDLRPSDAASLMETRPDVLLSNGVPEFYEELNTTDQGRVVKLYPVMALPGYQILIVGKKTCNELVNSNDTPILRNIDNALIAFVVSDMLKRDRHYAKAAQQVQEAQALLQEAIALEQKQSNAPRAARPLSVTGGALLELTDAVSSRLGMWDAASQNKIVESIRRNWDDLCDRELWTESVVILSMQAQGQQLILPDYIDKVIVVNNQSNNTIDVFELEYLFRTNPSLFDSTGSPAAFSMLPPVGVRVLPETDEQLLFVSDNPLDAFSVSVVGISDGRERNEVVSVTAATGVSANEYLVPLIVSKPPSLGTLTISGASSLIKFGEIPPNQSSVQHQRIWIQPTDSGSFNGYYFIVGKRKMPQLIYPTDAVCIRGCENALISMACGDVAADPAAAQAFKADAEAKIQTLIARETNQQSRRQTITPYTDRNCITDSDFWLRG